MTTPTPPPALEAAVADLVAAVAALDEGEADRYGRAACRSANRLVDDGLPRLAEVFHALGRAMLVGGETARSTVEALDPDGADAGALVDDEVDLFEGMVPDLVDPSDYDER